jgi:hypothetical protein
MLMRKSLSRLRLALLCALATPCLVLAGPRLAVFELRDEAALGASDAAYLTDRVRAHARQELPPGMIILTRESLLELIPKNIRLEDCSEAACDLEAGRKLGVDYVVSGELLHFSGELRLSLKASRQRSRPGSKRRAANCLPRCARTSSRLLRRRSPSRRSGSRLRWYRPLPSLCARSR